MMTVGSSTRLLSYFVETVCTDVLVLNKNWFSTGRWQYVRLDFFFKVCSGNIFVVCFPS